MEEQFRPKERVGGSSPSRGTIERLLEPKSKSIGSSRSSPVPLLSAPTLSSDGRFFVSEASAAHWRCASIRRRAGSASSDSTRSASTTQMRTKIAWLSRLRMSSLAVRYISYGSVRSLSHPRMYSAPTLTSSVTWESRVVISARSRSIARMRSRAFDAASPPSATRSDLSRVFRTPELGR